MFRIKTPTRDGEALRLAMTGTSIEAVIAAWNEPGPHPDWHERAKSQVRDAMPVLALALDRLARDHTVTPRRVIIGGPDAED
jgi:hypothetical protein